MATNRKTTWALWPTAFVVLVGELAALALFTQPSAAQVIEGITPNVQIGYPLFIYGRGFAGPYQLFPQPDQFEFEPLEGEPGQYSIDVVKVKSWDNNTIKIKIKAATGVGFAPVRFRLHFYPWRHTYWEEERGNWETDSMLAGGTTLTIRQKGVPLPGGQRVRYHVTYWGEQYVRPDYETEMQAGECRWTKVKQIQYANDLGDPSNNGPNRGDMFTSPFGRYDDWMSDYSRFYRAQEKPLKWQWPIVCSFVTAPGVAPIVGAKHTYGGVSMIVNQAYYRLNTDSDSEALFYLGQGRLYLNEEYDKGLKAFLDDPLPSRSGHTTVGPCSNIYRMDASGAIDKTTKVDASQDLHNCNAFRGSRSDRVEISLSRTFISGDEEVDPDDPFGGFRAYARPYSSLKNGFYSNLILVQTSRGVDMNNPISNCTESSIGSMAVWNYTFKPDLLVHELAHVLAGFLPDYKLDGSLLYSNGERDERGFNWYAPNEHVTAPQNCAAAIASKLTK